MCHPGAAHKCGHDGHSAVLEGLALELTGKDREEEEKYEFYPGRDVYLIFQHAEEIGAGGEECDPAGLKLSFEESDIFPEMVNAPAAVEKVTGRNAFYWQWGRISKASYL